MKNLVCMVMIVLLLCCSIGTGYADKAEFDFNTTSEIKEFIRDLNPNVYSDRYTVDSLSYPMYRTIAVACTALGEIVQHQSPVITFIEKYQEITAMNVYLKYYADCTKKTARAALEDYSDTILAVIQYAFPNIDIQTITLCWMVPAIDEESFYAAQYTCENVNGTVVRGSGTGIIYSKGEVGNYTSNNTWDTSSSAFPANKSVTERRNALEFYNLYALRMQELDNECGTSVSPEIYNTFFSSAEYLNSYAGENEYYVKTPAGTLLVSMPDFGIVRYDTLLFIIGGESEEYINELLRASMAYASLEYDGWDEYSDSMLSKYGLSDTGSLSFVLKKSAEFSDMIGGVLNDKEKMFDLCKRNGNRILLASLNYNYYLDYTCGEDSEGNFKKYIGFIAEEK